MICNLTGQEYNYIFENALKLKKSLLDSYGINNELDLYKYFTSFNNRETFNKIYDGIYREPYENNRTDYFSIYDKDVKYQCTIPDSIDKSKITFVDNEYSLGLYNNLKSYYCPPAEKSFSECIKEIENYYDSGKKFMYYVGSELVPLNEPLYEKGFFGQKPKYAKVKWAYVEFSKEEAIDVFTKIYKTVFEQYKFEVREDFLKYQFDFSPIILNLNKTKLELIDGFKRLLLIEDEKLDFNIPVKVYNNLSDYDFMKLLFYANYWKSNSRHARIDDNPNFRFENGFYDRGFLFSLVNKFNLSLNYFDYKNIIITDDVRHHPSNLPLILTIYLGTGLYRDNPTLFEDLKEIKNLFENINNFIYLKNDNEFFKYFLTALIKRFGRTRIRGDFKKYDLLKSVLNFEKNVGQKSLTKCMETKLIGVIEKKVDNYLADFIFVEKE